MAQRIARIVLVLMLCSSLGYSAIPNSGAPSSSMWSHFSTAFTDFFNKKGTSGSTGSSGGTASSGGGAVEVRIPVY